MCVIHMRVRADQKRLHNGGVATSTKLKTMARWPRVGGIPYQALPLLRFFAYKIHTREKVQRKGEGEPEDEAISSHIR